MAISDDEGVDQPPYQPAAGNDQPPTEGTPARDWRAEEAIIISSQDSEHESFSDGGTHLERESYTPEAAATPAANLLPPAAETAAPTTAMTETEFSPGCVPADYTTATTTAEENTPAATPAVSRYKAPPILPEPRMHISYDDDQHVTVKQPPVPLPPGTTHHQPSASQEIPTKAIPTQGPTTQHQSPALQLALAQKKRDKGRTKTATDQLEPLVENEEEVKEPTSLPPAEDWGQHIPVPDTSSDEDRGDTTPHTRPSPTVPPPNNSTRTSTTAELWEAARKAGQLWKINLPTDTPAAPSAAAPQQTLQHDEDDQHKQSKDEKDDQHDCTCSSDDSDGIDLSTPMDSGDIKRRRQFPELELHKATAITKETDPGPEYKRSDPPTPGQSSVWTAQPKDTTPTPAPTPPHDDTKHDEADQPDTTPGPDLHNASDPPRSIYSQITMRIDMLTHISQSEGDDADHIYTSHAQLAKLVIEERRKYLDHMDGQHEKHIAERTSDVQITSSTPDSVTFTGHGVPSLLAYICTRHSNIAPTTITTAPPPVPPSPPPVRPPGKIHHQAECHPNQQHDPNDLIPNELLQECLVIAEQNPTIPLPELRTKMLATVTTQRFLHPEFCYYTIEQHYATIDCVIQQEATIAAQDECRNWIAKVNIYPPTTALEIYMADIRVIDPGAAIKDVDNDMMKAILKQRACDSYNVNIQDNRDILKKIHYYIDYTIDKGWGKGIAYGNVHESCTQT